MTSSFIVGASFGFSLAILLAVPPCDQWSDGNKLKLTLVAILLALIAEAL